MLIGCVFATTTHGMSVQVNPDTRPAQKYETYAWVLKVLGEWAGEGACGTAHLLGPKDRGSQRTGTERTGTYCLIAFSTTATPFHMREDTCGTEHVTTRGFCRVTGNLQSR